MKGEVCNFQK